MLPVCRSETIRHVQANAQDLQPSLYTLRHFGCRSCPCTYLGVLPLPHSLFRQSSFYEWVRSIVMCRGRSCCAALCLCLHSSATSSEVSHPVSPCAEPARPCPRHRMVSVGHNAETEEMYITTCCVPSEIEKSPPTAPAQTPPKASPCALFPFPPLTARVVFTCEPLTLLPLKRPSEPCPLLRSRRQNPKHHAQHNH